MPVPELRNNGWITVPWAEYVGRNSDHGTSFTSGYDSDNRATLTILVNWEDGQVAEQDILGTAQFIHNPDDPTTDFLQRIPPVRHPWKPFMRAEQIVSATAIRWDHKMDSPLPIFGGGELQQGTMSVYSYWLMVIGFVTPKFRILTDQELQEAPWNGREFFRYCEVETDTTIQTLSREGGQWKYADAGTEPFGPNLNWQLTAPVGVTLYGATIHVKWKRVPRAGLFGSMGLSDFYNDNIASVYGCVNSTTTLWDMPGNQYSGVLRFAGIRATPFPSFLSPAAQNLAPSDPNLYYDAEMQFAYFDPPSGNPNLYRGHNLAPSPTNNLWYLITTKGSVAGTPTGGTIYETADISKVFQLSAT